MAALDRTALAALIAEKLPTTGTNDIDAAAVRELTTAMAESATGLLEEAKTGNATLSAAMSGKMIVATGSSALTFAIGVAVASSAGERWWCRNDASEDLTIDPNASEQINGAATLVLEPGQSAMIWANAGKTAWRAIVTGGETGGTASLPIYATQADAEGATIPDTTAYIIVAEYQPNPRFFERLESDPGSGDRFDSADGAWWRGLPLAPSALDYANAVARSADATLAGGDLGLVHVWTVPIGTIYTATLPDADSHIGKVVQIEVDPASRGLLAFSATDPIGLFAAADLVIWAGESLTLQARAGRWAIIGGACRPASVKLVSPGSNIGLMNTGVSFSSGWTLDTDESGIFSAAEHCIAGSGQIVAPRKGRYACRFSVGVSWSTAPSYFYALANGTSGRDAEWGGVARPVLHPRDELRLARGGAVTPRVVAAGGASVVVSRTTIGYPAFTMVELPQW